MIDREKYLTVPEFASMAGIAKQGIYEQAKKENSKLYPYLVFLGKKIYISIDALQEYNYKKKKIDKAEQDKASEKKEEASTEKQESKGEKQEERARQENGQAKNKESQDLQAQFIDELREDKRRLNEVIDQLQKQNEDLRRMLAYEQQAHNETQKQLEEIRKNREKPIELIEGKDFIDLSQEKKDSNERNTVEQEEKQGEKLNAFQKFIRWLNS